jgi:AcrR family transcriptional regulator
MARVNVEARLLDITAAGRVLFGRLGYRRTRMAEVAAEAGLSSGAIYTYVESKEALFHLVLAVGFGFPLAEITAPGLPLPTPAPTATLQLIDRSLKAQAPAPLLRAALHRDHPLDIREELGAIVAEQYAMIGRLSPVLSVIEACAIDLPELDELYFGRRRRGHIDLLGRYLQQRAASGHLACLSDMAVAGQIITEAVAWFAWKRLEGHDAARFDDEQALRTLVEFVCNALVPPAGTLDGTCPQPGIGTA